MHYKEEMLYLNEETDREDLLYLDEEVDSADLEEFFNSLEELEEHKDVVFFVHELPMHRQLKVKRVADNLSSTALAKHLQLGLSTLSDIENGRRNIPAKHRGKIEEYLYREYWYDGEYVGPISQ